MRDTFTIYNEEEDDIDMDIHLDNLRESFMRRQSDISIQSNEKKKKKKKIPAKFTSSLPLQRPPLIKGQSMMFTKQDPLV